MQVDYVPESWDPPRRGTPALQGFGDGVLAAYTGPGYRSDVMSQKLKTPQLSPLLTSVSSCFLHSFPTPPPSLSDRSLLCSPGWPRTPHPPASASTGLGMQEYGTMLGYISGFLSYMFSQANPLSLQQIIRLWGCLPRAFLGESA